MKIKSLKKIAATGLLSLLLAPAFAAEYPLKVDNCGYSLSYKQAPKSVVTIGQAGTELLYTLGLEKSVAGTSLWFNPVLSKFEEINKKIPRLADNDPSFENVLSKRPDLILVQFEWQVGKEGMVATREQFHDLGVNTYVLPSDCEGKDNLKGGDGTRTAVYNVKTLYKGINQISEIFNVKEKGDELIKKLKSQEEKAIKTVKDANIGKISAALWFSSADMAIDPYMAGQNGVAGYMMRTLGINNVIKSDEEWPTVGWETIAKDNPDILIIARMNRRRFPADDWEKKMEFLKTDAVTKHMKAVQNNNIVLVDADALQGSVRMFDGMQDIANEVIKIKNKSKK